MMASVPTVVGRASHWSPLRTSVPFVIVAVTLPLGTPGTAIRIGLAIPAYNTFISIGATVALGSVTKYSLSNSRRITLPSLPGISIYPLTG